MQDLAHLEVLQSDNGNHEQALVDLQLGLAAYTQAVVKGLCDSIPKLVYSQLVAKVQLPFHTCYWYVCKAWTATCCTCNIDARCQRQD